MDMIDIDQAAMLPELLELTAEAVASSEQVLASAKEKIRARVTAEGRIN